jgi:hypothetical protein
MKPAAFFLCVGAALVALLLTSQPAVSQGTLGPYGDVTSVGATAGGGLTGGCTRGPCLLGLITTCSTNEILKWGGSSWACAVDGGGGISNSAGSNVIMKSDGTNAVASSLADTGTLISAASTVDLQFGNIAPSGTQKFVFSGQSATDTTMMYIRGDDTLHTAYEAISLWLDQRGTYDTTLQPSISNGLTVTVSTTKSAGANTLTNVGIDCIVGGGDANVCLRSQAGQGGISISDESYFGPLNSTDLTTLGEVDLIGTAGSSLAFTGAGGTITTVGNITTTANLLVAGAADIGGFGITLVGGGASNEFYFYPEEAESGSTTKSLNISASGTGKVRINGNTGGVPNAGTGGLEVYGGANDSSANFAVAGNGNVMTTGTYQLGGTGGPTFTSGTGSPEGVLTAPIGSLFSRTNGSTGTTLYVKESGAGNTGWAAAGGSYITSTSADFSVSSGVLDMSTAVSAAGTMSVAGLLSANGALAVSGYITATSYLDVTSSIYANNSNVVLNGSGISFAYGTNATATGCINCVGYAESTGQFRNLQIADGKGASTVLISGENKHAYYYGAAPTLGSCTGCTIASYSTDARGRITCTDGAFANSCTVTFAVAYTTNPPACSIQFERATAADATNPVPTVTSASTSAFTFNQTVTSGAHGYAYRCDGML